MRSVVGISDDLWVSEWVRDFSEPPCYMPSSCLVFSPLDRLSVDRQADNTHNPSAMQTGLKATPREKNTDAKLKRHNNTRVLADQTEIHTDTYKMPKEQYHHSQRHTSIILSICIPLWHWYSQMFRAQFPKQRKWLWWNLHEQTLDWRVNHLVCLWFDLWHTVQ